MAIVFEGTIATRKNTWTPNNQIPKKSTENSKNSSRSEEVFDPQCESPMNIDEMKVEFPLLSRARMESNKRKCLATHSKKIEKWHSKKTFNCAKNIQLFEADDKYYH